MTIKGMSESIEFDDACLSVDGEESMPVGAISWAVYVFGYIEGLAVPSVDWEGVCFLATAVGDSSPVGLTGCIDSFGGDFVVT